MQNLEGSFLITCPGRDLGFLYRAVDASRCKRLQESVEATFMGEAVTILPPCLCLCVSLSFCFYLLFFSTSLYLSMQPWTVMIYSISRSKWKLRRMQNACYVELRNGHLLRLRYPFMLLKEGEYCWSVMKLL